MRIDIVTIFPQVFDVLDVSLLGKARESGIIDLTVHDLREFTHDRHRTVDDTPYGGGAGMVMKPEPWGEALDGILEGDQVVSRRSLRDPSTTKGESDMLVEEAAGRLETSRTPATPLIIFPSPAGDLFTQQIAQELSTEPHLVFACGRYEGIDERVVDYAVTRSRVRKLSLGDYVLNGGEVATLAMIEAVGRLIPGVVGNPESLIEESHTDGLLEYPSYTKPASWRGFDVPPVLLSGNHAAIAAWRREQQLERTREIRPDLLRPGA
ncbi:MAG: tRNA (guanosine(37)-N1)-methyltransferase TrmD [Cryobacterium sp.]|nr:tRNA (guanosine(37)-N1)-methyltransferase TrmD [Cryobacterium sp.]